MVQRIAEPTHPTVVINLFSQPIMNSEKCMSDTRITFGFPRTECACTECALNCRFIPGYLIPTDLTAMAAELGYDNLLSFALKNLLASPGATVMANGELFQLLTLVPARQANGACQFLTTESRCAIHSVSPYGCSHFDVHQSQAEADERSLTGLSAIAQEWKRGGLYAHIWTILHAMNRRAPSPLENKAHLKKALVNRGPK
jgi:Fe-S-cluster containining protein